MEKALVNVGNPSLFGVASQLPGHHFECVQAERSLCKCTLDSAALDRASRLVKYFIKVVSHLSEFFSACGIIDISKLKPGADLKC